MCVCVYTHMHIYICIYIYTHTYISIHQDGLMDGQIERYVKSKKNKMLIVESR